MTDEEVLARIYTGLDREGPGDPADVAWAIKRLGLNGARAVCDAGCGSGADSETLANALPKAQITAIEQLPHLVKEAQARCERIPNVTVRQGDMARLDGPFDLIWCAGAIYFLGVTAGLRGWRSGLAAGGTVAFSEPVLLGSADETVSAFWQEYPAITNLDGIAARIEAADFEVLDHRQIIGAAWQRYYTPLAAHLVALRATDDPGLREPVAATEREIALWRTAQDRIAYALMLARPR
ncbi:class I SAM-dependent methyltransferase [Sedimentitalea todarodis]|uniref:Class I SAM-dependent methyltransferase n=1 Tax=Sedimentitalea todarodis TaxID=1631240 RepID=A0ABU3VC30_9RHOB|nr:class I SAM-dependent methyltransferase [Sedimentitalea todarodis]MDU9003742.1 class I SAM-dependent methyltransferase [Sedimentitalea todarodis]